MEKRKLWFLCCLAHSLVTEILCVIPFLQCSVYCQEHNFQNCTLSLWSASTKNLIQPHIFQWYDCKPTIFNETGPQQHLSWFLFCAVSRRPEGWLKDVAQLYRNALLSCILTAVFLWGSSDYFWRLHLFFRQKDLHKLLLVCSIRFQFANWIIMGSLYEYLPIKYQYKMNDLSYFKCLNVRWT